MTPVATETATSLVCSTCPHRWDTHYPEGAGKGCAACSCPATRPIIPHELRRAAIREQVGTEPLVSHVDDKRLHRIGHYVTEGRDGDDPRSGTVVERWRNEDGEPGVVAVEFRTGPVKRGERQTRVVIHRFLVSELRDEFLPDPTPSTNGYVIRNLAKALGQRTMDHGRAEQLNDTEIRYLRWIDALSQPMKEGTP